TYLPACLDSHAPLDLVMIALGANDLKARFKRSAADIADGVAQLVSIVQSRRCGRDGIPPKIIIVVPAPIGADTKFGSLFDGAFEIQKQLPLHYGQVAQQSGCELLDLHPHILPGEDGIHLDAEEHRKIASLLEPLVKRATV